MIAFLMYHAQPHDQLPQQPTISSRGPHKLVPVVSILLYLVILQPANTVIICAYTHTPSLHHTAQTLSSMGFSSASLGPGNHYSIYVGEKGNQFFRDEASRPGDEVVSPRNGGGRGVASASSRDVFLLYARKMAKNKRSHYRISTQAGRSRRTGATDTWASCGA